MVNEQRFSALAEQTVAGIRRRMIAYEYLLRGGRALFDSGMPVQRTIWANYVKSLDVDQHFPGVQGIGYSQLIRPEELANHLQAIRAEGFPNYRIHPEGQRPLYSSIIFLEPFRDRNLRAFGYDMYSEAVRRAAMDRAWQTGKAMLSGKVTLVQEDGTQQQAGVLLYLPHVAHAGTAKQSLLGWIYSPFRMDDLMADVLRQRTEISVRLFDQEPVESNLLYRSHAHFNHDRAAFRQTMVLTIAGRRWLADIASTRDFDRRHDQQKPLMILLAGLLISTLLGILVFNLGTSRARAVSLAQHMTRDLRSSQDRFELVAQASNDGIWDWNLLSGKGYLSPRCYDLLGYAPQHLPLNQETLLALVLPDDHPMLYGEFVSHIQSRTPLDIEVMMRHGSGEYRWFRIRAQAVWQEGTAVRMAGSLSNIHAAKQAQRALEESEGRLRHIIDGVVNGIITVDELGYVESYNVAAERIFQWSGDEVIDREISMLLPQAGGRHGLRQYIDGMPVELLGQRRDGTSIPISLGVSSILLSGKQLYIAIVRDLTGERLVDQMKREFVSTVSHELRTPLTSIRGSIALILGTQPDLPEQTRLLLDVANRNSDRLLLLINDILDMEKLQSGDIQLYLEPTTIRDILEPALEVNREYARQFGVAYRLIGEIPEAEVNVDKDRIAQVMANLLSNAAKFSPAGETVEISARSRPGWVRIAVTDRGPGISAAFTERIFQRFSQSDSSDSRAKGGTGLGLYISKLIVIRHHGEIGFHSEPHVATTFYFELPLCA